MHFTTKITIPKSNFPIDYQSKVVALGSCFAVNMGEKFNYFKFDTTLNPFGILFHPLAIHQIIRRAVEQDFFTQNDFFFHNERWHCFEMHSDLSSDDKEVLLQNANQLLVDFKNQIANATHILITYGTSWVYKEKASQTIVANCHKMPQAHFEKELLSIEEIETALNETLKLVQSINSNINIVLTVSPVRHLKDGFIENQRSKSHLIAAMHQVTNQEYTTYFPAYEILMDELRDYRFYAEDLLHPNSMAIDYIWERFSESSIATEAFPIMEEINSIQKGLLHKPFHPDSESHKQFLSQLHNRIGVLQNTFPGLTF